MASQGANCEHFHPVYWITRDGNGHVIDISSRNRALRSLEDKGFGVVSCVEVLKYIGTLIVSPLRTMESRPEQWVPQIVFQPLTAKV